VLIIRSKKKPAIERIIAGLDTDQKLIPLPLSTTISLSVDILPYVRKTAIKIAMGTARRDIEG
jgi:hypothetical protein